MNKNTKRFYFFQITTFIALLILYIFNFNATLKISPIFLISLLFLNIVVYDLGKGFIIDLNINQFQRIWWSYIVSRFFFAILIWIIILILAKIFNPMVSALNNKPSDVGLQIIGGGVAGIIGFLSAIFLHKHEQKDKDAKESKELVNQLWFEIINNKILLEKDIRDNLFFLRKLERGCWNSAISSKIYVNGITKGGILTLYSDIDFYNYLHELQRLLIAQGKDSNLNLTKTINELRGECPSLLGQLKRCSAILFGEMVRLGYRKESDWIDLEINWKQIYEEFNQKKPIQAVAAGT